ncbi:MAG: PPC domain-containing protein [Gammaproteobacteria bacterium]|nr:PPC domain-containing protein [Gammaproteobacteria bacterium]
MEFFKSALLIASLLILTACGGSSSSSTDNNDAANATPIDLPSVQTGNVSETGDDIDVFKITVPETGYLILELTGPDSETVDLDLGLYIDDTHSVAVSGDSGSYEEITEYISSPGIYYVAVIAFEGAGDYSLNLGFAADSAQAQ